MRRTITALFALGLTLGSSSLALAHSDRNDATPDTSYTFDDHAVPGARVTPDDNIIPGRTRRFRETLVRPRVHFVPELLKSVERL
ncbi:MAG: hypothetical protein IT378_05720 [Sandaracinaceae bacterium]|nr:hypothetical protein [Sandaracinaceae bacterium]